MAAECKWPRGIVWKRAFVVAVVEFVESGWLCED